MKIIFKLILLRIIYAANCDYYTAISGIEKLLYHELFLKKLSRRIIDENYIDAESHKNSYLRNFIDYAEHELNQVKNFSLDDYGCIVLEWRAMKRISHDWLDYARLTLETINEDEYEKQVAANENPEKFTKPTLEDLKGAAKGIARVQRTYNLETSHLANGTIMGKTISIEMKSTDCYELGRSLLEEKDYKRAANWLMEARIRRTQERVAHKIESKSGFGILSEAVILESLVPAVLESGNTKFAYLLAKEHLALEQNDLKVQANIQRIEQRIHQQRLDMLKDISKEPISKHDTLRELYEKTCRGDLKQTPHEQPNLRCRYESKNMPYLSIAPFKMQELCFDPYVVVYYDIYKSEIRNILKACAGDVERSQVGVANAKAVSEIRTSKNKWLCFEENSFLQSVANRLTHITGLSLETAEPLQVANYGIDGHYEPHYDFVKDYNFGGKGNRILTGIFYINDVKLGGATAFPYLKLAVPPSNIAWWFGTICTHL